MWENDLAREFKKRNNKPVIGACIGIVQSVTPLKASIYDGQIMIDDSNGYICNHLLEHSRGFNRKGTDETNGNITINGSVRGSDTQNGTISIDGTCGLGGNYPSNQLFEINGNIDISGEITGSYNSQSSGEGTGEIKLHTILKAGDMVLVVPSGDEQKFFIVDILKGVS